MKKWREVLNEITTCYWEYKVSENMRVDMLKRTEKKKNVRNFFFIEKILFVCKLFFFFLIYLKFRCFKISNVETIFAQDQEVQL